MNARAKAQEELLLRRLVENDDESAAAALFLELCRQSPELRHWLREDYARDAKLRAKVDGLACNGGLLQVARFADLTNDRGSWSKERQHLKASVPGRIYGGLTWNEVMALVYHYQAGALDLGAFVLVRHWRETGRASPLLLWAGLAFLESVLPSGRRRLLRHLDHALAFTKRYENTAHRRAFLGHADWWKLQALLYMLRHPRESYRTRDVRAHLASLDLQISSLDFRRFCKRHGIRRDMRAGRPRKLASEFTHLLLGSNQRDTTTERKAGHRG